MALRTTRRRTKAALGTDADDTDAAVEVKLKEERCHIDVHGDRCK